MNARPSNPHGDRRFTLGTTMAKICGIADVFEFDLDPCADALSRWGAVGFTDNGLALPWHGHVFVNPPWSDIGPWVVKAWNEMIAGRTQSVTVLLPDNRHGTRWWQEQVEHARDGRGPVQVEAGYVSLTTHYLPGRPRYGSPEDPEGKKTKSPPFGSMVLHFRAIR